MYDSIVSGIIILICLPIVAYWSVEIWRLFAEQRGSQLRSNRPTFLIVIS